MTTADEVCRLTGLVVGEGPRIWQFPRFNGPRPPVRSHSGPSLYRPSKELLRGQRVAKYSFEAVTKLMTSPTRYDLIKGQRARIAAIARRELRTRGTFRDLHNAVGIAALRAGRSVAPPLSPDSPALVPLANIIAQYALKLGVQPTPRAVNAMTAALLNKMTTGFCVGGTVIIPKVPLVAKHAPAELQHPMLVAVQCRAVSGADRKIVSKSVSKAGFAIPSMVLRLC